MCPKECRVDGVETSETAETGASFPRSPRPPAAAEGLVVPLTMPSAVGRDPSELVLPQSKSGIIGRDGKPTTELRLIAQTAGPLLLAVAGSGLAPLPCAFYLAGIPAGLVALVVIALLNDYSSIILIKAGVRARTFGYEDIMLAGGGKWAQNACRAALVVLLFGTLCGSLSVIWETGQSAAAFLGWTFFSDDGFGRVVLLMFITAGVLLPLSLAALGEMMVVSLVGVSMMFCFTSGWSRSSSI